MAMQTVNYFLIESALGYLVIAEAESGEPLGLFPDNESCMKHAFVTHIRPEIERWSSLRRERLKLSFAYFMDQPQVLESKSLTTVPDLTMPEPPDIQQFFLWLYEVLFPRDPISSVDVSNVKEDNDVMQMNFESGERS